MLGVCRASHHCSDRDTETSGPRKEALEAALQSLGVEIDELLQSDQVGTQHSGGSAGLPASSA